jgi:hypothetical protein
MRIAVTALGLAALAAAPAAAVPRLVDQQVVGWKRICSYEDSFRSQRAPGARRTYSLQVGRGEPCPHRYSAPLLDREPDPRANPSPR